MGIHLININVAILFKTCIFDVSIKTNKNKTMEKTSKFKDQKVVIIKDQPVKGGGINCTDKTKSNVVYEF